ncbi:putative phospholipase B-like 2 [Dinothrombium tinctorium]|uniref:Phospholipase B-like n=1 Tax=Dinothrombium tinctorium TaxID=1965070 RepID=A0A3S3P8I3_9ACAR|nr:putative phospholipase B-like 2 [Dinothrombium tinctorium]
MRFDALIILLFICSHRCLCEQRVDAKFDSERNLVYLTDHQQTALSQDVIATGFYENSINETGWSLLEVTTSPNASDSLQAYAAGLVEGSLTRELIEMHWQNTIGNYCHNQQDYCYKLDKFLKRNFKFISKKVDEQRTRSAYWHQVGLVLEQLAGLEDGLSQQTISAAQKYLPAILNVTSRVKKVTGAGSCSGLIKVLANNSDLFVSQDTWNDYQSMLRILKKFKLHLHRIASPNSKLIPGNTASFSSYPGSLQSGDDFYVLSSGLVTLETTIGNGNRSLYKNIKADRIVFEWIRSIVANRLANSGKEWAEIFSEYNSGTYNNQWMIVDYKLFKPNEPLKDNLLIVLEQIPTLIKYADLTEVLRQQTYWPSYNTPYFEEVFNLSGSQEMVKKYGDWFTYDKTPRALIFKRDQANVTDVPSMIKLMRYNNYKHDPLSRCDCVPPYSAENAIAARSDLNPKDGKYPFEALGHRPHGATDMKLTTNQLRKSLKFIAFGGPPYDDVPAFVWSKSDFNSLSHIGHPDKWTFKPIVTPFD